MGSIRLFIQHDEGKILKSTLSALRAAQSLCKVWGKSEIVGIALGKGASAAGDDALSYGLTKVFVAEDHSLEKYLSGAYAPILVDSYKKFGCEVLVLGATSTGKDLSARVAALLDAGQASDILAINDDGTLTRAMYAGNVIAQVEIVTTHRVVTVRPTAFAPAQKASTAGTKETIAVSSASGVGEVISYEISKGGRPELTDASIVVSGGRALGSAENFQKVIFPLADALNAAVGASRAAVDSGYAPNDWQVGQTGKVVAPTLYLGVGISGAIQHLAGMKDSKVIVAINKDADAPIFEVADYGLVADLFDAVPKLTEAIKAAKKG